MKKAYAMSDLHGQGNLFYQAVEWMEQDSGGDYLCFFLGDAIDRGPDGWEIMNYLLDHPDNFVYLKGNHEDLFVKSMEDYLEICDSEGYSPVEFATRFDNVRILMSYGYDMILHLHNGGEPTFTSWLKAGCPRKYIKLLSELPVFDTLTIVDEKDQPREIYSFCHAGCTMQEWVDKDEEAALWSRDHFSEEWSDCDIPTIMVHGHTPVGSMPEQYCNHMSATNILWYANGTKIDIDCACFRYGILAVLDIERNEVHYFQKKES